MTFVNLNCGNSSCVRSESNMSLPFFCARRRDHGTWLVALASFLTALAFVTSPSHGQQKPYTNEEIRRLVDDFKNDARGPFQAIKWFCPDGSVIGARERCSEPGGIQHALPKDVVIRLQTRNGVYLGQILAGTPFESFLDQSNAFSRMKQYQIEKYLFRSDDGWILHKARFYRGAYQAEDEEDWGRRFLEWALARDDIARSWFFTIREAARDIPHEAADNLVQQIRSLSKEISDEYPAFLDLRVKIHGQPEPSDTLRVASFRQTRRVPSGIEPKIDRLLADMRRQYRTDQTEQLRRLGNKLSAESVVGGLVRSIDLMSMSARQRVETLANLMLRCREQILGARRGSERLRVLDVSLAAENLIFLNVAAWNPATPRELLAKVEALSMAAAGAGLIELWEWDELRPSLQTSTDGRALSVNEFREHVEAARRSVEWGIGMTAATYEDPIALFSGFEPLTAGFLDDRMRSTVLLPLGDAAGRLGDELALRTGRTNEVMGLAQAAGIRGLNPGVAVGELVVVSGPAEEVEFMSDKVYVMLRAPAELRPVAGIATVTEGNVVSHVQLLARNLGIPNAVLSPELVRSLEPMSGRRVFYAVSPGGAVRLKRESDMTSEERALVEERKRSEERISVPIDRLDLSSYSLESLYNLRASDSGRLCGPKAANLGQLSSLFPGKVAPGFIIPFGVFRKHMDQPMPESGGSYWEHLRGTFSNADRMRSSGAREEEVEQEILRRLATLRAAIERMPFEAAFRAEIRARFNAIFGSPIGTVPVFVRSDTNMDDLKDFTGAGLNQTVPNVVMEEAFLQAIRRVWASPYRERGYRWRQKYLLNPEDVYPSILVLRSVDVEKSGVMITAGLATGRSEDVTVAFNRGVGGAVDGQAAESYVLRKEGGSVLLAPARELTYRVLPKTGGIEDRVTSVEKRILTERDLSLLRAMAAEVRIRLPGTPGIETKGPFDVELGFKDGEIVLFQTRPFVENKAAAATNYLAGMDKRRGPEQRVDPDKPLQASR